MDAVRAQLGDVARPGQTSDQSLVACSNRKSDKESRPKEGRSSRAIGAKRTPARSKELFSLNVRSDYTKSPARHRDSPVQIRDLHCEQIQEEWFAAGSKDLFSLNDRND